MKEDADKVTGISLISETQSIEEEFINTYRNLPELWNTEHEHYTNKHKRNTALDILLKIIKKWNPAANRFNVRQKINIMRSGYRKDLRKHLASKRYGSNGEVIYEHEPKNWKFHALRFLDKARVDKNDDMGLIEINLNDNSFENYSEKNNIASSDSSSENEEEPSSHNDVLADFSESETVPDRDSSRQSLTHRNKRIKKEVEDNYYTENYDMLDRELEAIGANVTCKLKRMNPEQRYHAELLINRVLITGLKNNLTDDTDLTEVYKP